jgi:hypothetical protein
MDNHHCSPFTRRLVQDNQSSDLAAGKYEAEKIHLLRDAVVPVGAFEPFGVGRESDDHGGSTGVF